jgi:hypothetical protein
MTVVTAEKSRTGAAFHPAADPEDIGAARSPNICERGVREGRHEVRAEFPIMSLIELWLDLLQGVDRMRWR